MHIANELQKIRHNMDAFVIGHEAVKEAMLLGLIAHEHIYLQGPPGCAKTMLAEVIAASVNWPYFFCQLHRDTRLTELIGDVVLEKSVLSDSGGEVVRQRVREGGVLTSEVVVLDDITRAPGEALNILLRLLNERKYHAQPIPLRLAIATSNPTAETYFNEPLDPAHLDRFTLQLQTRGTICTQQWDKAGAIVDLGHTTPTTLTVRHLVAADLLDEAHRAMQDVDVPHHVMRVYRNVLDILQNELGCNPANSLLSDRTMLVKIPGMIKAMAVLAGRSVATAEDLRVLKAILTFRVPEAVYRLLDEILRRAAALTMGLPESFVDQVQKQAAVQEAPNAAQHIDETSDSDLLDELLATLNVGDDVSDPQAPLHVNRALTSPDRFQESSRYRVKNLELLVERINGRLDRHSAAPEAHPGGSPRSWKRMRSLQEFLDTDAAEMATWLDRVHPALPRVYKREKRHVGGDMVIIRDVSESMRGYYARWAASVVTALVQLVRRKRMRIGYIEFNHVSRKYSHGGRFFTRDYDQILAFAANVACSGVTNYQLPLHDALTELRAWGTPNKHVVLLTDGEPTHGDWLVRAERRLAKDLRVTIHTLFIGEMECPEILDVLSEESGGCQLLAAPDGQGGLSLQER